MSVVSAEKTSAQIFIYTINFMETSDFMDVVGRRVFDQ